MAITVARTGAGPNAAYAFYLREIICDSSYPAASGGYSLSDPAMFGLTQIHALVPVAASSGYVPMWDAVNKRMQMHRSNGTSALAQETNGTDLSSIRVYVLVIGV